MNPTLPGRLVIPELLDSLPADHPAAVRSRKDLRRINFLMGNERWICRQITRHPTIAAHGICEIGAGDGHLCAKIAALVPHAPITAYDLTARPKELDPRILWHQGDLFAQPRPHSGGILVANLFLHHFEAPQLALLGKWIDHFDLLICNEPDRAHLPHFFGTLLHPAIHHVTKHDMHVSINAGFTHGELATQLQLPADHWKLSETSTWRGARRIVASRV